MCLSKLAKTDKKMAASSYRASRSDDNSDPPVDLSEIVKIKAQLGDDLRRLPIRNQNITYEELVLIIRRVFDDKLYSDDQVTIKYTDEDGDLVTIFDSVELLFAIESNDILRLIITANGWPAPLDTSEIKNIQDELQKIIHRIISLQDQIDLRQLGSGTRTAYEQERMENLDIVSRHDQDERPGSADSIISLASFPNQPFIQQLLEHSSPNEERAVSPDGILSAGSSARQQQLQQQLPTPLSSTEFTFNRYSHVFQSSSQSSKDEEVQQDKKLESQVPRSYTPAGGVIGRPVPSSTGQATTLPSPMFCHQLPHQYSAIWGNAQQQTPQSGPPARSLPYVGPPNITLSEAQLPWSLAQNPLAIGVQYPIPGYYGRQ